MGTDDFMGLWNAPPICRPSPRRSVLIEQHARGVEDDMRSVARCCVPKCERFGFADRPLCLAHWVPLPWQLKDTVTEVAHNGRELNPAEAVALLLACETAVNWLKANRSNLMPS